MLTATGVDSEIRLAFSGLHQLLTPVLDSLDLLPEEQAQALRCALGLRGGQTSEHVRGDVPGNRTVTTPVESRLHKDHYIE
ncbi:unnamed protein product [[Actinomadura] parvosata subsp. kistnae]|uniref:hypothetical protein n=1 Tax=[Actinomadura] parvosata TaxID=1955412 RepID=UPI000D2891F7|nr:unnamed protein product [Actinomadura parvosata subsp. kistnae]